MTTNSYDKVATLIGTEMDKAWKKIMEGLASGRAEALQDGEVQATTADLEDFFQQLGGAHMGVMFSSKKQKGETSRFTAIDIAPGRTLGIKGFEGSISIGGSIKF